MENSEEANHGLINSLNNFVLVVKAALAFENSYPRGLISILFFKKLMDSVSEQNCWFTNGSLIVHLYPCKPNLSFLHY